MKVALTAATVALLGLGSLALTGTPASAAIVCNGNTCWHAREAYRYPPHAGIVVHPDNWRWRRHTHYRWREHEGRGYWRHGAWVQF